jgi:hypothetical protein
VTHKNITQKHTSNATRFNHDVYRFEKSWYEFLYDQDHPTADDILGGLQNYDILANMGELSAYQWRTAWPCKFWCPRILAGIREFIQQPDMQEFANTSNRNPHPRANTIREIIVYHQKNLDALEKIVRAYDQWTTRYPGAAGLNLALQFIETALITMEGITTDCFEHFAQNLARVLDPANAIQRKTEDENCQSRMILIQVVRLIIDFMTDRTSSLNEAAPANRLSALDKFVLTATPTGTAADSFGEFIEDILALLTYTQLECAMLITVWHLLQVVPIRIQCAQRQNYSFACSCLLQIA